MSSKKLQSKREKAKLLKERRKELQVELDSIDTELDNVFQEGTSKASLKSKKEAVSRKIKQVESQISGLQKDSVTNKRESKDKFLFANRINEIKELKTQDHYRFYQIVAPAGYGKTFLLRRLKKEFERRWVTVWFSFAPNSDSKVVETQGEPITSVSQLLDQLIRSVGGRPTPRSSVEGRLRRFVELLTDKAPRGSPAQVILFFDAIERAEKHLLDWVVDTLIPDLTHRPAIKDVRGFFSSRYDLPLHLGYTYRLFPLSHFTPSSLIEVIEKRDPKANIPFAAKESIARSLHEICLGHPKCVDKILGHAGKVPALDDNNKLQDHKALFERIVKPLIYAEILDDTKKYIDTEALKTIFVLRKLLPPDLQEFFSGDAAFQQYDSASVWGSQQLLFTTLYSTGLFSPPGRLKRTYDGDPVVRHVLALESLYENGERFLALHQRALNLYEGRLKRESANGPVGVDQISLMAEALYYLARTLMCSGNLVDNTRILLDKLAQWREDWHTGGIIRSDDYRSAFASIIRDDTDLPMLLGLVAGNSGYQQVVSFIEDATYIIQN